MTQLRIAVIIGSTREGRVGDRLAHWFVEQAARHDDLAVTVVDLTEYDFPATYPAEPTASIRAFVREVGRADAFVVVTPEYNHSFPAPLKQAIDYAYDEWQAKPVGFVSYGCRSDRPARGRPAPHRLHRTARDDGARRRRDRPARRRADRRRAPTSCAATSASCSTSSAGGVWRCATAGPPTLRLLNTPNTKGKDHE